ncbi:MAG: bifunctional hydroxymethylpyrimidine kinase/phosphomethylpyrimidine kinase [Chthoniobacterales bacterium]
MSSDSKANAQGPAPNGQSPPVALTIAGSDSSAGAGIQADLKTFARFGVYGLNAVTCVVAETPGRVVRLRGVEPSLVREQLEVLLANFPVGAIKTGLLHSAAIVHEIAGILSQYKLPVVVDPVMIATGGDRLLDRDAIAAYTEKLFPLATLVTPNLDEAAVLLGESIRDFAAMRLAGERLVAQCGVPFLLKGGHLTGADAIDLLVTETAVIEIAAPFTRGVKTHGTGCAYSAAITAGLAGALPLETAVRRAKDFVSRAIAEHFTWRGASGEEIHALNHSA